MVNYNNSKIYKIIDNTNDNIYIGSTVKTLAQRLGQYRQDYKKYLNGKNTKYTSLFDILKNDNYDIILLEKPVNINSKDELNARERYYIDNLVCVNKSNNKKTNKHLNNIKPNDEDETKQN
jgi:hypothetical protein